MAHHHQPHSYSELPGGSSRGSQKVSNRNASTFDILSHNPTGPNSNLSEKQLKKEKQNQYRDQLDNMVYHKKEQKAFEKSQPEHFQPAIVGGPIGRPNYGLSQDSPRKNNKGGLAQHASGIEKNYNLGHAYGTEYGNSQGGQGSRPISNKSEVSTFDRQDSLRDQLLNRIRSGYSHQNSHVYNSYQRAHQEKEDTRADFERNVIDRAAQEKGFKEQQAAMDQWDKKKRLAMEMHEANKRTMEVKSEQKKREKELDQYSDYVRAQESLGQHERNEFLQKDKVRRLQEENHRVLSQQMKDSLARKTEAVKDGLAQGDYKVGWDSIDHLTNSRVGNEPLRNSSQLLNQDPYTDNRVAGKKAAPAEKFSISMGESSRDDQTFAKIGQKSPQKDVYSQLQEKYDAPSYGTVEPTGSKADYNKIRTKYANGSGFNILTGEYR